jgi:hypothetical protein
VGLAVRGADPSTSAASDAGSGIGHGHHFAFDLVVVIVEVDKLTVFVDAFERHHVSPAHLEAPPAPDARFAVDTEQVLRRPRPAVSR